MPPASTVTSMRVRSVLFGPASRVDFVEKFAAAGADIGVLDLEDATPVTAKQETRRLLADAVPGSIERGDMKLLIRTNSIGSPYFADDVEAARAAEADGIVVPKLEVDREVQDVREAMTSRGFVNAILFGGIESVAGVHRAVEICGAGIDLAYFGAEDFITDIGGSRTESNLEVLYARSRVAIAGRLANIPVVDQVVVDYNDGERFSAEASEARNLGYAGKLCIHPNQVPLANAAFTPSSDEIAWAKAVIEASDAAAREGRGVVSVKGTMVDAPIVARARHTLGRAT